MISKPKNLTRKDRKEMNHPFRGIYTQENDDLFASLMARYPTAIATLETALSLYGITDSFVAAPYFLSFNIGYRPVNDDRIFQIWENKKTRLLGTVAMEREGVSFQCYDKERLLLELFRREKIIATEAFQAAIFHYRKLANEGKLNLPKIREYCEKLPKGELYRERIRREIL